MSLSLLRARNRAGQHRRHSQIELLGDSPVENPPSTCRTMGSRYSSGRARNGAGADPRISGSISSEREGDILVCNDFIEVHGRQALALVQPRVFPDGTIVSSQGRRAVVVRSSLRARQARQHGLLHDIFSNGPVAREPESETPADRGGTIRAGVRAALSVASPRSDSIMSLSGSGSVWANRAASAAHSNGTIERGRKGMAWRCRTPAPAADLAALSRLTWNETGRARGFITCNNVQRLTVYSCNWDFPTRRRACGCWQIG